MNFPSVIASAILVLSIVIVSPGQAAAQSAVPATAQATAPMRPSIILQPALSQIQGSTSALNIRKWKAPGRVREATQQDVDSIQRDLANAVPTLLEQADAAPASVSPSFALYRNIDALYDVLLRVSETADLAAPSNEAASLDSALQQLESARKTLGDLILQSSQRNEAELASAEAAARRAKAEPARQKREVVVDDGPEAAAKHERRRTRKKKRAAGTSESNSTPK